MQVIPVIDLLNGEVVRAERGDRANYRPIRSPLTQSSIPTDVIDALLANFAFDTLYIADLNSIQQGKTDAKHYALIQSLCKRYPQIRFWVDAGINNLLAMKEWEFNQIEVVLGSENCLKFDEFAQMMHNTNCPTILSLDFKDNQFLGHPKILEHSDLWPSQIIAMTLSNVGSNLGPNWEIIRLIKNLGPKSRLFAAGGVRSINDLEQLQAVGVNGALVASALHQKQISNDEIRLLDK